MATIDFRPLTDVTIVQLANTFNTAFADYLTTVQLTPQQLQVKMQQENIDLDWSVGAFVGPELVGFVMHGVRQEDNRTVCYNAGTGVVPAHRGKALTASMYAWWRQQVATLAPSQVTLEVIAGNDKAIHIYSSIGFRKQRTFNLWKGKPPENTCKKALQFQQVHVLPWASIQQWWRVQPCWSAAPASIEALQNQVWILTAELNNQLVGYCCIAAYNGRLLQLAVAPAYRKKGIASALLAEASRRWNKTEWMVLNVDAADEQANRFFANMHWQILLQQYEMTLSLRESTH